MAKKFDISDEDRDLFRKTIRGTKPLQHTKLSAKPTALPRKKQKISSETDDVLPFSDFETLEPATRDTILEYSKSGLQYKMLRKLRQGQYNVEAILDLHGKTIEEARDSLGKFLIQCQRQQLKQVLIIHGKGHGSTLPVLKNKLNHWLRQTDIVLAFCSSKNNSGALLVLLKS